MRRFFMKPSHLATAAAVLSASAESGLTTQAPVSGASNRGALRTRASGTPTAATSLDVALTTGGLAMGPFGLTLGVPGSAFRWRNTGDADTAWRGHTDACFTTYNRMIDVGSVVTDYPAASEPRTLKTGAVAYIRTLDATAPRLQFVTKTSRTGAWSASSIPAFASVVPSVSVRPGWVVLPSGRLIVFCYVPATETVDAYTSTDDGATWSVWSTATRITCDGTSATICAEVVGDAICVVTGGDESGTARTLRIAWSVDQGQTFATTYTAATMNTPRTCVTATGQVLLAVSADAATTGSIYPVLFGGGIGASLSSYSVRAGAPQIALCTLDDGTIWRFTNGAAADPLTAIDHAISLDNGTTWSALSANPTVYNNGTLGGTPRGPSRMVAGSWGGSIMLILVTDCATAAKSNGHCELLLGGYDTLTETYRSSSEGAAGTNLYSALSYIGDDLPDNLGWTKADVGGGATVAQTDAGLNLVGTFADNSSYTIDPGGGTLTGSDGFRLRYYFKVTSGGSIASNTSIVNVSHADGGDRQWFTLRHTADQIRLVDQSGTLATSASVTGKFTGYTEVLCAWAHDYPAAGGGTLSVWYRDNGDTRWTVLVTNQAIAEQAGSGTDGVTFGGTVAGGAVDWTIGGWHLAEGGGGLATGFTNPDNLHGRALSSAVDVGVANGVSLGAFGGSGIQADTFTVATTYQQAARNIWLAPRLPCRWSSGADNTTANVVFYNSGNTFSGNVVTLHGTNMPRATVQWATSDSWGSPAYSVAMSAAVWSGVVSSAAAGLITVEGAPWTPHRFRSERGRRWFVEIDEAGTPAVYEVTDNGDGTLYVGGLASAGLAGKTVTVFGDRMGAVLPMTVSYAYMRLSIVAMQTADDAYRVGFVAFNVGHEVTRDTDYDNGFVDRYLPNTRASETVAGYTHVTVLGPEHPELRIAWGLQHRGSSDYLTRVVDLFRSLRGDSLPVVFWRDTDDVSTLGLYRAQGPPVVENSYGELSTALARVAQIILREETT